MSNSLIKEKSPYLRQHAENPVDWLPWGEEAFYRAGHEDKPIFLSIGYSTCHWCHVMARESFEDSQVAALLNRYYIPVKVDREERPDVDSVYMQACQALTGSGGWPLTIIMTADKLPFFAGTYIPKNSRGNQAGLIPLLSAIARRWAEDRESLLKTAGEIGSFLSAQREPSPAEPGEDKLKAAAAQLAAAYDREYGGFGTAPKFPSPHDLLFLLRLAHFTGDKEQRQMVDNSLRQMYRGGIYDHFGGGFSRYSTDREWLAPHFEKTLYDNALLSFLYTEAWQEGHTALYRDVAENTLDYCLRELKAEGGGFFSAQDADSRGVEGAYYLFTPEEVKSVLGDDAGRHFCNCYDITPEGNFHGKSIPNLLLNNRWNFVPEGYEEYREKLRLYREERLPLFTDEKILTGWNGLMLMALSRAAFAFGDRRYLMEARELAEFMGEKLYEGGRLMARLCDGELRYEAQLDDYAFYALGLLELYRADFKAGHIASAQALAGQLLEDFADEKGGFFRSSRGAEKLFIRPKEVYDGALPSGNSAAALLFEELFRLTGKELWREAAEKQLGYICSACARVPAGCAFGYLAMLRYVYGGRELVCALPSGELPESFKAVLGRYAPELTVLVKDPENGELLSQLAPFTADMQPQKGKAACYICQNGACSLPVTEL
ncbi:MAG TPA: thioredoxin domain-containing protein [Candidatus Limivicinus faecipullorum]|nr:thioredoxin domain-containing protein [Candidatus Limivicinus faecipullorum]